MDGVRHWEAICALAKGADWIGEVPRIKWDLRNAINSLTAQQTMLWEHPQSIPQLLIQNPGVTEIFTKYNDIDIAYALRLARYAKAR